MNAVDSPCVRVCRMDLDRGVCIGCMRTLDEISYWTRLSAGQREQVLSQLPGRRAAFEQWRGWAAATCERCGAGFSCGASGKGGACWCVGYPPVTPAGAACLCPTCLAALDTTTW